MNIEEAFRGQRGEDSGYEPFNGIVLTDTFNLNKGKTLFPKEWLPDNNERAERQQQFPIQVIVGNPPWSAGQRSSTDDNPNVEYPELEARVRETYVEYSTATLRNSLYDTYKMAIRWASDRIEKQGIIAFVTNGSWIDGKGVSDDEPQARFLHRTCGCFCSRYLPPIRHLSLLGKRESLGRKMHLGSIA